MPEVANRCRQAFLRLLAGLLRAFLGLLEGRALPEDLRRVLSEFSPRAVV